MKLYSTGLMEFIATVTALLANVELREKFNSTQPYIFWGAQIVLLGIILIMAVYTLTHWDKEAPITKTRFFLSIFVCLCIYAIAYTASKYAFILILVLGVAAIALTRYRFGLVKRS